MGTLDLLDLAFGNEDTRRIAAFDPELARDEGLEQTEAASYDPGPDPAAAAEAALEGVERYLATQQQDAESTEGMSQSALQTHR